MNWRKLSRKATDYLTDEAAGRAAEFALTKVGPYRVMGIVAKLLMVLALVAAACGWYADPYSVYLYAAAVVIFGFAVLIHVVRNFLVRKAAGLVKGAAGWAASAVKDRYASATAAAQAPANPVPVESQDTKP